MSRKWLTFWCVALGMIFAGSVLAQEQKVERISVINSALRDQYRQSDLGKDLGGPVPTDLTTDILINNNDGFTSTSQFTQSESDVLAFGNIVIVVYNDAGSFATGSHFTGWSRSTDGGVTFTDGGVLPSSAVGDAGDPVIARSDANGRIYFSTLGFNSPGNIQMFRSTDNGATWMPPVNASPGGTSMDKQWHTVDNFPGTGNGNVYLVARDFSSGNGVFFWRSTDNGDTWGSSGTLIVSGMQGAFVTVGSDHAVYAFWYNGTTINVRKSVDFGVTFGAAVTVASGLIGGTNGDLGLTGIRQGTTTPSGFRSNEFPHAAANPISGNIYVTYNNKGAGVDKGDIFLVQSTDGGTTWSAPVKVNDDVTTTDQWQPTVVVTPSGSQLGIFYYSREEDPTNNNLFKFYGRIANVSGATITFTPSIAVSDSASLPEFGRDAVVNSVYMSDYQHAYATPTAFNVAWSDNRSNLPGGASSQKDPNMYFEKILTTNNFGWVKGTITNVSGGAPLSLVNVDFLQTPNAPSISDPTGFYKAGVPVDTTVLTRNVTLRAIKFGFRDTLVPVTVTRNDTIIRNFGMTPVPNGTLVVRTVGRDSSNISSGINVLFNGGSVASGVTDPGTGIFSTVLPLGSYDVLVDPPSPYGNRRFNGFTVSTGSNPLYVVVRKVVENSPAAMRDTLAVGQIHAKTLTLTNTTPDPVPFRLGDDNALLKVRVSRPVAIPRKTEAPAPFHPKGAPEPQGPAQTDSSGGPDAFGYRWIDSDSPGGPVFNWVDISGVGTAVSFSNGDDGNTTIPFPFSFPFYGVSYTSNINVCTNGFLSFTSTATDYNNIPIPSPSAALNGIFPFWDDLYLVTSGTVYYYNDAANNRFIVEYLNVPHFSTGGPYTFEAIFTPDGSIVYQYLSMDPSLSNSATVGIQDAAGSVGLQVVYNGTYVHNNLALKFFLPNATWLSETPFVGTINPNSSQNITVTFDATDLTLGTLYNANIIMDLTHPDVTGSQLIPASLRVISGVGPVISVSPTTLTFPLTIIGNNRRDSVRVRNVGSGTPNLILSSVTTTNARYVATATSTSIAPGDSARIRVVYTPIVPAGTDTGRVIILCNDPANPRIDIQLSGTSIGSILLATRIDSLVKPNMQGGTIDSTRFFVRNVGTSGGNIQARAIMIPRTSPNGPATGPAVVVPMKLSSSQTPINYPNDPIPPSVGVTPVGGSQTRSAGVPAGKLPEGISRVLTANAYGNDYRSFQWTVLDPTVPGTLTGLGPISSADAIYAGDFTMDGSRFLAIKGATNELIDVNITNGTYTVIGPVTIDGGHTWTSAKFDPTSGTFYAVSTNITVSSLYTIDPATGTTTRVATISNMPAIIGMAIQPGTGQMYGYDIVGDSFYSIDKVTGAGTLIGPIGFNANLAQDMAFDRSSGILYMCAYDGTALLGQIRTVDLSTGATTLIGQLGTTEHLIDPFSIQGSWGPSSNWLSIAPTTGSIALNDSLRFTATFDATSPAIYTLPGNYFGRVEINTVGAPAPDTLKIPARMFVVPSPGADLKVEPDSVNVGNIEIGVTDSSKSVLIRNIGASTLTVTNVTFTGSSGFSAGRTSFTLPSLDTLRVKVKFTASAPGGVRNAIMHFTCNDPTPDTLKLRAVSVGVAHFTVRPDTFAFSRQAGTDTTTVNFKIFSTGTDSLRYRIDEAFTVLSDNARAIERSKTQHHSNSLGKGVQDPTPGERDSSGGPDAFGYRWIDSDSPGGPVFNWLDISGVGTAVSFSNGDDGNTTIPFPYSFPFYGTTFSGNINVCTNGWLSFTDAQTLYSNTAIPSAAAPLNGIFPFWDDLYLITSGTVYYYNDVANNRFVVEYLNVPHFSSGGPYTFEVIFKPEGTILYQYLSMDPSLSNSATVGVQDAAGAVALQVAFDATYIHDNLAVLITSDLFSWMSTNRTFGTIAPGDSQTVQLRIHPAGLVGGDFYGVQKVSGNTPDIAGVRVGLRIITGVGDTKSQLPTVFALSQNYPNPFNPTTKIKYDLPEQATVALKIYNILGQEVMTLANGEQAAGRYEATWEGRNNFGAQVSSGVYFYRFEATGTSGQTFSTLKKMLFLK